MSEAGGAAIGRVREGARVIGTDGSVGKVIEVLVGDKADERYLGVRTGGLFGRDRHVAAYDVRQAAEDIVWLRISRRDVLTTTARAPHALVARSAEQGSVHGPTASGTSTPRRGRPAGARSGDALGGSVRSGERG